MPVTRPFLRGALALGALSVGLFASPSLRAQEAPAASGPPLAPFAAMRIAIVPVQLWRPDSVGWSRAADWAALRIQLDTAIAEALRDGGMGSRWAYAGDVVRGARRNPIYSTDPYALGVGRWRGAPPKAGDDVPEVVADNLRPITALGDTRYALIPVELRVEGDLTILRLILADTRARKIVWGIDLGVTGPTDVVPRLAARVSELVLEP